jgi:hypothetical protein
MPAFRGPDGKVVYVPDEEADRYRTGSDYQEVGDVAAGAAQNRIAPTDNGITGSVGATVSSALSGATLGGSDWLLKGVLDKGGFEQLAQDRRDNPVLSGIGQTAGAFVGGATPAGYLGKFGAAAAEGGGVATKLGVSALEGSVYNAGAYLADTALGDRDLSAEGLVGALGSGMEFGVGAGAVALGVEKGTIAARRMFSRLTDGSAKAQQAAEQAWAAKYQSTIEAHDAAADIARAKLAEASLAR